MKAKSSYSEEAVGGNCSAWFQVITHEKVQPDIKMRETRVCDACMRSSTWTHKRCTGNGSAASHHSWSLLLIGGLKLASQVLPVEKWNKITLKQQDVQQNRNKRFRRLFLLMMTSSNFHIQSIWCRLDSQGAAFLNCSVTCIRIQCDVTVGWQALGDSPQQTWREWLE